MWCDNCLLILPLRHGAMAWGIIMMLYNIAGGIFLFEWGSYIFFTYPEWAIYGGIAMAIAAVSLINVLALANRSYIWTRVCKFIWPFLIVISLVRAIIMIVELQRGKAKINWECDNGQQLWPASEEAGYGGSTTMPSVICTAGFPTLWIVFIIALLVDFVFQLYMFFMTWRYEKLLQHYSSMKPSIGGYYYNA